MTTKENHDTREGQADMSLHGESASYGKEVSVMDEETMGRENGFSGPVEVRRSVFAAAKSLEQEAAGTRWQGWQLAQRNRERSWRTRDGAGVAFWQAVFEYLMTIECVAAGTPVAIIEEVRTPRARTPRRRSGTDSR